jgi:alkylhydroperoxidase family enzyme
MRGICVPADSRTYLPGVEADPKPGVYRDLIEAARARGGEYAHIWDLFAFQHDVMVHLARLSEGIIRRPSTISVGMRELIAAYTSHANACAFCTNAHAAAAGELLVLLDHIRDGPRGRWTSRVRRWQSGHRGTRRSSSTCK